jgi:hypothetical protein
MDHTEAEYASLFREAFSDQLLMAITLGVIDGYKATPGAVKKAVEFPDRHDVFGAIRRGKIDQQLRGVAELNHLRFDHSPNEGGSWWFFSIFSGRFRLAAYLAGSKRHIRPANIRKAWAKHNRDGRWLELFPGKEDSIPEDAVFVAFMLHGPRQHHRDQPAYIEIVITDPECRRFICKFELFKMFPNLALQVLKSAQLTRKEPKPRKRAKEKGDEV